MSARKPKILAVNPAWDEEGRRGVPGFVDVQILLRGIKGEPIETYRMSRRDALRFAVRLLQVIESDEPRA